MKPVALINVVGLSASLIGDDAPRLRALVERGRMTPLRPTLPAVTCSVQASMLTGKPVREHGIVGNGWYFRELAEVRFWNRSSRLIEAEPVWEAAKRRDAAATCANLFWWHNTYSSADVVLNVRPMYKADGRKLPDCYSEPAPLRDTLQRELGTFPLYHFWGPRADITSSRWIVNATMRVYDEHRPTLTLVYLPHLDYALQKFGPGHAESAAAVREIDAEVGRLLDYFDERGVTPIVVSEYGIEPVDAAVAVNRVLRDAGFLRVRIEDGRELLDAGACEAFAVADHQVAHVYVRRPERVAKVASLCAGITGVEAVLDRDAQRQRGIDHPRAGELVLVADRGKWFTYDYWHDDAVAPDFARTVDIHRKPGYDPRELFIDPAIRHPKLAVAMKLLRSKAMNMRTLMDLIPLDTSLVKGSHGRVDVADERRPVLIAPADITMPETDGDTLACEKVHDVVLNAMFGDATSSGDDLSVDA
ncbi:alkaline phosphatase family protein [Phycisphaerales bacterium AB-hyl4]|uniref:Alkaline phosphatase family protein n=1 Tax=Natronomicrosphaera hydrolytica TaxID=3242702 RepID=A0ABV4TZK4_9BACT